MNGNKENDSPINDRDVHQKANYHGGDLDGIIQKLKEGYFSNLGVNAIWLSPVTQNPLHAEVEYPSLTENIQDIMDIGLFHVPKLILDLETLKLLKN